MARSQRRRRGGARTRGISPLWAAHRGARRQRDAAFHGLAVKEASLATVARWIASQAPRGASRPTPTPSRLFRSASQLPRPLATSASTPLRGTAALLCASTHWCAGGSASGRGTGAGIAGPCTCDLRGPLPRMPSIFRPEELQSKRHRAGLPRLCACAPCDALCGVGCPVAGTVPSIATETASWTTRARTTSASTEQWAMRPGAGPSPEAVSTRKETPLCTTLPPKRRRFGQFLQCVSFAGASRHDGTEPSLHAALCPKGRRLGPFSRFFRLQVHHRLRLRVPHGLARRPRFILPGCVGAADSSADCGAGGGVLLCLDV